MAYRLKQIRFHESTCNILLQNENGPCPLLAAANALILRGAISLPSHCVQNSVASLEDLTNMLVNHVNLDIHHEHYIDELLTHIPRFQAGMDVNPKFTQGCTGYEPTAELGAFEMLGVTLVHGWLVDPRDEVTFVALQDKTYNELVEIIIEGNEATSKLENDPDNEQLHQISMRGTDVQDFLNHTGHQLTVYGLERMYDHVKEGELCAFFRNNHYCTLTKHEGILYTLVTDYGYANSPDVIWEKLDVIDGDTEYVNSLFKAPGQTKTLHENAGPSLSAEELLQQSGQNNADYQLALQLSKEKDATPQSEDEMLKQATEASMHAYHGHSTGISQEEADLILAQQLQSEGVPTPESDHALAMKLQSEVNGSTSLHEDADRRLAQQLQAEENRLQRNRANQNTAASTPMQAGRRNDARTSTSNCVIS